jgi:DNA helicase-2/ATP-dependent DNA helicase PcrA
MTDLNPQQHKAVTHTNGPVMIIAGPGTGKTKTLTARITHLINNENVPPEQICALTFTKKAATEVRERLMIDNRKQKMKPTITTFHGLGYNILTVGAGSEPPSSEGRPAPTNIMTCPTVISQSHQSELIDDLLHRHFSGTHLQNIPLKELIRIISAGKTPQSVTNRKQEDLYQQLVDRYNTILEEQNLLDYDDLLIKTHDLLQTNAQMKHFQHVLIDEFQDTSLLQYQIARLLTSGTNLFVIGDPHQSIYSFRGVTTDMFAHMRQDMQNVTKITLAENYRSGKEIIQLSSSLFPNLAQLTATRKEKARVSLVETLNEYTEADWIVKDICKSIGGTNLLQSSDYASEHTNNRLRFSDCAVIYRTHHTARVLEQTFIDSGIPYQMIGGKTLYDNQIVRFIIIFFQYIHGVSDEILWNLLQLPILRIPQKTIRTIHHTWQESASHQETLEMPEPNTSPLRTACQTSPKAQSVLNQVDDLILKTKDTTLSNIAQQILADFDLNKQIQKSPQTKRHVYQFLNSLVRFDAEADNLHAFLDHMNYLEEHEYYDQRVDAVTLMTMHASKGLEFQSVFVCGFEDGIIPFTNKMSHAQLEEISQMDAMWDAVSYTDDSNSGGIPLSIPDVISPEMMRNFNHIAEEKRLLYVALTRAKDELQLIHTQERGRKPAQISRFSQSFDSTILTKQTDEAIEKIHKKRKKQQDKNAQMTMF